MRPGHLQGAFPRPAALGLTLQFLFVVPGQAAQEPADAPRCEATRGRRAEHLAGIVHQDSAFRRATPAGWVLTLAPTTWGWVLHLSEAGREEHDLSALTPPFHFVPNPREIEGWHFRNSSNTGPNDGSVNAPSPLRDFIFSPWVGRGITYQGSATTDSDVRRVSRFGRGWVHLDDFELTPPRLGERAAFLWLRFSACLTWPISYRRPPGSPGRSLSLDPEAPPHLPRLG